MLCDYLSGDTNRGGHVPISRESHRLCILPMQLTITHGLVNAYLTVCVYG